ncbi:MAG: hypothetical protein ACFHVJ_20570 [Aestuariibacter sp.]
MGLSRAAARFFIDLSNELDLSGHALTLGRQALSFSSNDLPESFRPKVGPQFNDQEFLKALGFSQVSALDIDDYEGAGYLADLNQPDIDLGKQFSCVFDSGTLEHIFHLPNALSNIYNLLEVGGRIVHTLPVANRVDHGFYMFSPTWFWDYYQANRFLIEKSFVLRNYVEGKHYRWELFPYFPSNLDWLSMGKLDNGSYSMIFIAQKTARSLKNVIPQQRNNRVLWNVNRRHAKQVDIGFKSIHKMGKEIWLLGLNEYSLLLGEELGLSGFIVKGIIDSLKFGYSTPFGEVLSPREWQSDYLVSKDDVLFCTRSLNGSCRNENVLKQLSNLIDISTINAFDDQDMLPIEFPKIAQLRSNLESRLKHAAIDTSLKLPQTATY